MLALGALLTTSALLALAGAAIAARSPGAPRWATASWSGELITLAIVAAFALGLANLIAGAADAYDEGIDLVDLGLLAVVLCGAALIWRQLGLGARMRALTPVPSSHSGARATSLKAAPRAGERPSRPTSRAA